MPTSPRPRCRVASCASRAAPGSTYCLTHRPTPTYDLNRPSSPRRGYTAQWRAVRLGYLAWHPWCELCEGVKATEVHHVVPLANGGTHDPANLQALCKRCHSSLTAKAAFHGGTSAHNRPLPSSTAPRVASFAARPPAPASQSTRRGVADHGRDGHGDGAGHGVSGRNGDGTGWGSMGIAAE